MVRDIYLHLGTHKTATTSIQNFLSQNHEPLKAAGILYPKSVMSHNNFAFGAHHILSSAIYQGRPYEELFTALGDELGQAGNIDTLILSSETFGLVPAKELVETFESASALGHCRLNLIQYIRPQAGWTMSMYLQRKSSLKLNNSFSEYYPTLVNTLETRRLNYKSMCETYLESGVNYDLRLFAKPFIQGDICADFLAAIGHLELYADLPKYPSVNKSVDRNIEAFFSQLSQLHRLHHSDDIDPDNFMRFFGISRQLVRGIGGRYEAHQPYNGLTQVILDDIYLRYSEDNQALFDGLGMRDARTKLFTQRQTAKPITARHFSEVRPKFRRQILTGARDAVSRSNHKYAPSFSNCVEMMCESYL